MPSYYRLNVRFNPDDPIDRQIIEILNQLGDRGKSRWVRRVLYEAATVPSNERLLTEIRALRELVERLPLQVTAAADTPTDSHTQEPPIAAANLDGLLGRLKKKQRPG